MSKIPNAFKNGKAFIGFLTAGDPTCDKTVESTGASASISSNPLAKNT